MRYAKRSALIALASFLSKMVSILILTKNEESDLPACLKTVDWSSDIHVFDSFSTDRTVEIAHAAGAVVRQRKFDNYASQRNAALETCSFIFPWILVLDADERVPKELADEIHSLLPTISSEVSAFRIRRNDFFMGKRLRYAQISPFYIRLFRRERVYYEREINEVLNVNGVICDLQNSFLHYPFSKGLAHWIDKHNIYSTMEAAHWRAEQNAPISLRQMQDLVSSDFHKRRFVQKRVFYRAPLRPVIKLVYMLFVRMAILDGKAGIIYSLLQAIYETFITLKQEEVH